MSVITILTPIYVTPTDMLTIGRVLPVREDIAAAWTAQGRAEYMPQPVSEATAPQYEKAISRPRKPRKK
jgi:hypothetical protein